MSAPSTRIFPEGGLPAFFSATLPFDFVLKQPGKAAYQNLVLHWCQTLKPHTGYAGLGFIQSIDRAEKLRTVQQVYGLAKRFPGLEVDHPRIIYLHIGAKMKGVNWLTILSDSCLESLGGRTAVLSRLDDGYQVFEYEGGVMIQAGPTPQPGDVNRRNIPIYYRKLSQILKPLRMVFPEGHSFIRVAGRDGSEVTNEWLARFDK
jgi:hypothetical protein